MPGPYGATAAFLGPVYGGYMQGQMQQQQLRDAQIATQMRQLELQQAQQQQNLNLSGLFDIAASDPTLATYAALSGATTPSVAPQPQGAPMPASTSPSASAGPLGLQPSGQNARPPGYMGIADPALPGRPDGYMGIVQPSQPVLSASDPRSPDHAAWNRAMDQAYQNISGKSLSPPVTPPSPQPSAAPAAAAPMGLPMVPGQVSLGQLLQKLKQQNPGVPDMMLLNAAAKVNQILNPYDKQLLEYMLKQNAPPTQFQQQELALRQEQISGAREDRAATNALRVQLAQMGMAKSEAGKWQVMTDPKTNDQFRYNTATGEATTLDGKPYSPQGAQKVGTGGQPRSAPAMAMKKYMEEHPDATAEDIAQFGAAYGEKAKAARDFGTGPLGNSIRSINTAVQHLDTAKQAGIALGNNDTQALNKLKNAWAQQFGSPLPTNFDAIKQIVGQEVVKAIVAGGGGVTERQQAGEILSRANSPAQLSGAIDQIQKLMAGQLNSLRQQYQRTVGLEDFDQRFLMPETRKAMSGAGYEAAAPSGGDNGGWKIERVQ